MHSFGLYESKTKRWIALEALCNVSAHHAPPVRSMDGEWVICIRHLYSAWIDGIRKYEADVRKNRAVQRNFGRVFPMYGHVRVVNVQHVLDLEDTEPISQRQENE